MKNSQLILYIGIVIIMFLSTSVAAFIGLELVGTFSSLIIVTLFVYELFYFGIDVLFNRFKEEFLVVFIGFIIIIMKYSQGDVEGIKQVLFFILIPMSLSILIQLKNGLTKSRIKNIILFFFVTECLLAIYEKVFGIIIFPYMEDISNVISINTWEFRSSSFLGHPLANALVVSSIMGFVLTSSLALKKKMFYVIVGSIALLCFNARGAILAWGALAIFYIFYVFRHSRKMNISPFVVLVFSVIASAVLGYLMLNYGFGARLFHNEIMDASANTRLDVLQSFSFISSSDFWFGNSANYKNVMEKLGAGGVENSFVVIILNYGIVMFVLLFISIYFWIRRLLKNYTLFHKFLIIISFLVVGSMNNSLSEATPWVFFILCIHSFPFLGVKAFKKKLFIYYMTLNKFQKK